MLPVIDTQLESTGVLLQKPIVHEFVKGETSPCQGVKILKQDIQTLPTLWRQTLTLFHLRSLPHTCRKLQDYFKYFTFL